jgi:riboflavin kinase/FMN adenylyltransferase
VALTFDPHPMRVLQPDKAPLLLTSTEHKLALIEKLGMDACLVLKFDRAFSETPAEKFIEQIAFCRQVFVGSRFRFGHNRAGTVGLMRTLAPKHGFTVKEIKSVLTADGELISSTAVRNHVLAGRLERSAEMLGRPFSILGTVTEGDRVGRDLGYPTANIDPHNEAIPPNGVYAANVHFRGAMHRGIVNIGVRPTFTGRSRQRVIEVHILDFAADIYGQDIETVFVKKLREEQKFTAVEALKRQIAEDEKNARALLG